MGLVKIMFSFVFLCQSLKKKFSLKNYQFEINKKYRLGTRIIYYIGTRIIICYYIFEEMILNRHLVNNYNKIPINTKSSYFFKNNF